MDTATQLWLLKQIYQDENKYFDKERGQWLCRIPKTVSPEDIAALESMGHGPNHRFLPCFGDYS